MSALTEEHAYTIHYDAIKIYVNYAKKVILATMANLNLWGVFFLKGFTIGYPLASF